MAPRSAPSSALTGPFPSAVATTRSAPTCTLTVASVVTPSGPPSGVVTAASGPLRSSWSVMTRNDSTAK